MPSNIKASCPYFNKGYSILVVWEKPVGVWTHVEILVNGKNYTESQSDKQSLTISGVKPATTHDVSVTVLSKPPAAPSTSSETFRFKCKTDPRGACRHNFFFSYFDDIAIHGQPINCVLHTSVNVPVAT